uniref:Uncharacterized protein n=1 Tax=Arundo donax TaxID=35708 RepID=A0A0A9A7D6_ARUDO
MGKTENIPFPLRYNSALMEAFGAFVLYSVL